VGSTSLSSIFCDARSVFLGEGEGLGSWKWSAAGKSMRLMIARVSRSPADVTNRLDRLIKDIRRRFHENAIGKPNADADASDVLLVAHGHILRAFAMRWIGRDLADGVSLLLEGMFQMFFACYRAGLLLMTKGKGHEGYADAGDIAGGVGTLSYEHHRIEEPAIL